jgi:nucleoside-diphosphate-sugar epimerase
MAFADCTFVIHTASPFSNKFKKNEVESKLIKPAIQGTENVLSAVDRCPSVKRVVLTSSVAAIAGLPDERGETYTFTEKDWSLTPSPTSLPYYYSKREAEKKAWEMAKAAKHWDLAVMNPGLVMGPPAINRAEGESINTMKEIIKGDYSAACPKLGLAFVDVRDVAAAHCLALFHPKAGGQRFILSAKTVDIRDMVKDTARLFPAKVKAPNMTLPRWLGRVVGPMMGLPQDMVSLFGRPVNEISSKKVQKELGLSYLPTDQTLKEMVVKMDEFKMIKL